MARTSPVQVRRVYDPPLADDGSRVLVDRIWPRGISKEKAELSEWLKGVAPSTELRKWYNHDPERYDEFLRRYTQELKGKEQSAALTHLRDLASSGPLTLLTASKAVDISQAAALAKMVGG